MNGHSEDGMCHVLWNIREDTCYEDNSKPYLNQCFIVKSRQRTYKIPPEKIVFVDHTFYYHETQPRVWNIKQIEESFIFGRSQLKEESQWISNQQFLIQNHRLIHMGKNSTYVNGVRVKEKQLEIGDQIVVLGCVLYYFENWILCSQPFRYPSQIQYKKRNYPVSSVSRTTEIVLQEVELEPFKMPSSSSSISLFQTLSASSMMLVSTIVGMLIQIRMQPQRMQDIAWMSITSFTMACSCILIGCLNRQFQNKKNRKEREKEEIQYKEYVNHTLQQCLQQIRLKNEQFETHAKLWDGLDASLYHQYSEDFKIPIQKQKKKETLLILPKLGYEYKTVSLYDFLLQTYEQSKVSVYSWRYFEKGQKIWIQSENYADFFIQFAWVNKTIKWVWIGNVEEDLTWQPICMQEHKRLWVRQPSDVSILRFLSQKNIPYVLGAVNASLLEKIPKQYKSSIVYFSMHNAQETFDSVYSSLDIAHHSIQQLRMPPIRKSTFEKHWNQTFSLQRIEDLNIQEIRKNQKDMQIPIGFSQQETIVLDLHDAHGLVAGTTGSGKSEFLMSLLFQLCVRFSSRKVQYILVDFKGGAFSYAFEQLAHCAGIITNLEDHEMERFQMSLQSEMERRQTVIADFLKRHPNQTAHIDALNRFETKMSHLFIIIDEFAQLKSMYPDMLQYLIEIARIGRSLGVHLILSTQKPSGIVDEQIWANSKFRICFRVQTPMDSREVLMHDKACHFDQPGQFCLQYETVEKMGTSLYSQDSINAERPRTWQFAEKPHSHLEEIKVSEYLTKQIQAEKERPKWIVCPSLKQMDCTHLALIDIPQKQCIQEWDMEYGQSCFLLMSKKEALQQWKHIIRNTYDNVYIWNENVRLDSYWQLLQTKEKFTLVLEPHSIEYSIFQKENVRLFYVSRTYDMYGKDTFMYHVACSCMDKDSMKNMFQTYRVQLQEFPYASIQMDDVIYTMKWKTRYEKKQRKTNQCTSIQSVFTEKRYAETFRNCVIGYDAKTFMPIAIEEKQPCILLYENEAMYEQVCKLMHVWKKIQPALRISFQEKTSLCDIWVGHAETMKEWMMSQTFQTMVYDAQIVWLSYGCNEYVQWLHKPMVFEESELILWNKGQKIIGEILKLK